VKRLAFALLLLAVGGASAHPQVQTGRTIVDRNHDNRLEYGPAEPIQLRTDLAQHGSGGAPTRLLHFAQMTDTQLVDEESPARVEYTDGSASRSSRPTVRRRACCRWCSNGRSRPSALNGPSS
jgi:hypothetical protein